MTELRAVARRATRRVRGIALSRLVALATLIFGGATASAVLAAQPHQNGEVAPAAQPHQSSGLGGGSLGSAVINKTNPTGWVGTWASAQVESGTTGLAASGFKDQTVRDIVHTSVGGSEIKLRISNVFGTEPLQVSAVYVGQRRSGAAVEAGTNLEATFGGSDTVIVQPGEEVLSDPVKLKVGAEQDLAVSIYFAGATGPATWHPEAASTNYYASGDAASDTTETPYTNTDSSWYFLSGVDVLNHSVAGAVVTFGPSTTDGTASTSDADKRYPDDLARRLLQLPAGEQLSVLNAGISGNELLTDAGTDGAAGVARFYRDVIQQDDVRDVIIWEGTNDIAANPTINASELTDAYQELIDIAHQHGIKVIGATPQPVEGNGDFSVTGNATRLQVNNWIRTSGAFDGVADFSTVLENPANPNALLPAYDSGDHLHPNDTGYQAIADSINLQELTSPLRAPLFSGTATASPLSETVGSNSSYTQTITVQSLTNRTYTLPWRLSAPSGSGVTFSPSSGRLTIPANGSETVTFTVHTGSSEGSYSPEFDLLDPDGESALASHFTVTRDNPGDLAPFYNNAGITNDAGTTTGVVGGANLDGDGNAYSQQLLTAAGLAPGATVKVTDGSGVTFDFTWPNVAAGQPDNVEIDGQTIVPDVPAGATEVGFLGTGTNSGTTGSEGEATINYTDGTSTTEELGLSGYALGYANPGVVLWGNTTVADTKYLDNGATGVAGKGPAYVFEESIAINPDKTVANIVLPTTINKGQIHVFAAS
jgi:lysophospholipase L1-like esterase